MNLDNAGLNRQLKQLQSTLLLDLLPLPPASQAAVVEAKGDAKPPNEDSNAAVPHDRELQPGFPTPFEPRDGFERRFENLRTRDAKAKGQAQRQGRDEIDEKDDDADSLASDSIPSIRRGGVQ